MGTCDQLNQIFFFFSFFFHLKHCGGLDKRHPAFLQRKGKGWATVKKNEAFLKKKRKNAHDIHIHRRGKKLKNTKINYRKNLHHCLLIFRKVFALCFLCAASLSPRVSHSFSTNLLRHFSSFILVHFQVSNNSPYLGVKSAQWWL